MTRLVPGLALACAGCFSTHVVDAEAEHSASGERLLVVGYAPEGGGDAYVDHVFDREVGAECLYWRTSDGSTRCLPRPFVGATLFADADCERRVVSTESLCGATIVSGATMETAYDTCTVIGGFAAFEVGARLDLDRAYERDEDGACVVVEDVAGPFAELTRLPDERFVRAERRVSPPADGGRVGSWAHRGEDGSSMWAGHWDLDRDEECFPYVVADGPMPCLPHRGARSVALGGAACDEHYAVRPDDDCPFASEPWFVRPSFDEASCRERSVTVHRMGAPVTPSNVSACTGFEPEGEYHDTTPADAEVGWIPNVLGAGGRLRRYHGRPIGYGIWSQYGTYFDTELGVECNPHELDGVRRCAPVARSVWSTDYFTDEACTEPVVVTPDTCSEYVSVSRTVSDACAPREVRTYYRLAGPLEGAFQRTRATGECRPVPSFAEPLFRLEPVPAERFAAFERVEL